MIIINDSIIINIMITLIDNNTMIHLKKKPFVLLV